MQSSHHVSPYSKQSEATATSANKLQPTSTAESKTFFHHGLSVAYMYIVAGQGAPILFKPQFIVLHVKLYMTHLILVLYLG